MGALPGKCKHPRKGNPYYGNDETKVCGRNPGAQKGCYDIREAKDRTTTVGHVKDPEGNIPCYGYGETPPGGIRQNTVKRAMTRTKRQAGAHPRTSVSSRKGKIRTRESGKLHPEDKSGELVMMTKPVNKENIR